MEVKKFMVGEKEYMFVNSSRNTRNGFAHDTTLFINNVEKMTNTCHYLNRTWEVYRYQTVMMGAIRQMINNRRDYLKNKFKEDHGYKRLNDKTKLILEDIFTNDSILVEYEKAMNNLQKY